MRYFRQGLLSILGILATAFAVYGGMRVAFTTAVADAAFYLVAVAGMMAMGFMYRRWNGPLIFTRDGISVGSLSRFALGGGVVLGPLNVSSAIAEGGPIPVVFVIVLVLLSPLFAAASLTGPMFLGSWFFDVWILRTSRRLQTDSAPPVRRD